MCIRDSSTKESAARRARPGARATPRKKKGTAAGPDRMIFSEMVGRDEEMNDLRHAVTGLANLGMKKPDLSLYRRLLEDKDHEIRLRVYHGLGSTYSYPDGTRFEFLHRWYPRGKNDCRTRMLTAAPDGSDVRVVDHSGCTSHFIWRDPGHILAWSWAGSRRGGFCLFEDKPGGGNIEVIGGDVMYRDGHCTYLPGNAWILNDTYPDARIVCCVRNPYEAVPSFGSLLSFIWGHKQSEGVWIDGMRDVLLEVVGHFYRHPLECLPELPEDRQALVPYDTLTTEPKKAVLDLYRRFGFSASPAFEQELDAQEERSRTYKSKHAYSLEEYGLTPEDILQSYRDLFEHYDFDTEPAGSGA